MGMLDRSTAQIIGPDGTPTTRPVTFLSFDDATTLRAYAAWLEREQLLRDLYCASCGEPCEAHVTAGDIGLICPCRMRLWKVS